jgi:hypothetical protein
MLKNCRIIFSQRNLCLIGKENEKMFINTWSERSSFLADLIIETVNNYTTKNNIEYNAFYTFSGFNDRVIIAPTLKDLPDYFMISFIIGWAYADAELAVVHRFDNDTRRI